MSAFELELTFLAKEIPQEIASIAPVRLVDTYIPEDADHPIIRLRQMGSTLELTKKVPHDGIDFSQHEEYTIPLSQHEYEALRRVSNRSVEKDRYEATIADCNAQVDVFDGALKGLVLIDFEFADYEAKANFMPPACCLADVTQDEVLAGGKLAGKSYDDIAATLSGYGYQKLEY